MFRAVLVMPHPFRVHRTHWEATAKFVGMAPWQWLEPAGARDGRCDECGKKRRAMRRNVEGDVVELICGDCVAELFQ